MIRLNQTVNILLLTSFSFQITPLSSQDLDDIRWLSASKLTIEGKAWRETSSHYQRLPDRAKEKVRDEVWELSTQSAGISIRFYANTDQIYVRYQVDGEYSFPHMPATGKSGVDLYGIDADGKLHWLKGSYSFQDTISYNFKGLTATSDYHDKGREYRLYLPLYVSVKWMEVGVPAGSSIEPIPSRQEKPIVVYGTSIAQGACASRPGMAWSNILERNLDWPVINLGFSGNGRLEDEVVDYINEIDAAIYILDCLPNLTPWAGFTPDDAKNRLNKTVKRIREQHPKIPILLVDHSGYAHGSLQTEAKETYESLNKASYEAFQELTDTNIGKIYYLSKKDIGLGTDSYVDGVHPTDFGMQQYAHAYEKEVRKIMNFAKGSLSTTRPVTQDRDAATYDWRKRHMEILDLNAKQPPKIVFIGNSITHFWGGKPKAAIARDTDSWDEYLSPGGTHNLGFGWDRIENVLWRIYHGELDGFEADKILLLMGTNNLHINSDEEIIEGLVFLAEAIQNRQPKAEIMINGILPRVKYEERILKLNQNIADRFAEWGFQYVDPGTTLLNNLGKIDQSLFLDGLHPNKKGYQKVFGYLKPLFE